MVPHPPQTLVPSSGRTTPSAQLAPPAGSAWCLTPPNPCSFVRKHHAPEPNSAAGGNGVVPHPPQTLIPSSGSTTPSTQMTPPAPSLSPTETMHSPLSESRSTPIIPSPRRICIVEHTFERRNLPLMYSLATISTFFPI